MRTISGPIMQIIRIIDRIEKHDIVMKLLAFYELFEIEKVKIEIQNFMPKSTWKHFEFYMSIPASQSNSNEKYCFFHNFFGIF